METLDVHPELRQHPGGHQQQHQQQQQQWEQSAGFAAVGLRVCLAAADSHASRLDGSGGSAKTVTLAIKSCIRRLGIPGGNAKDSDDVGWTQLNKTYHGMTEFNAVRRHSQLRQLAG